MESEFDWEKWELFICGGDDSPPTEEDLSIVEEGAS